MKGLDGGPIIGGGRISLKRNGETDIEQFFHVSDARGVGDNIVGKVVRLESSGEILGGN